MNEKKKLVYDKEELLAFMEANSVLVPILASPFRHKLYILEPLFEKIAEFCNCTQVDFQEYLNEAGKRNGSYSKWEGDEFLDKLIKNIEVYGGFGTYGWDEAGVKRGAHFIFSHKLFDKK
jgi:hypothetical protein